LNLLRGVGFIAGCTEARAIIQASEQLGHPIGVVHVTGLRNFVRVLELVGEDRDGPIVLTDAKLHEKVPASARRRHVEH
jgi:hypothetical protein